MRVHSGNSIPAFVGAAVITMAATLSSQSVGTAMAKGAEQSALRGSDQGARAHLSDSYGRLPISFELNRGQSAENVQFLARGHGFNLYLTPGEAVLSLYTPQPGMTGREKSAGASVTTIRDEERSSPPILHDTVRMAMVGSDTHAPVVGEDLLPGKSNYLIGNDPNKWLADVPTYGKVRYRNIYRGVDLVYYGNQEGRLEHDFAVAPGADPGAIRLRFGSLERPVLGAEGGLSLHTDAGDVTLQSPVAYQEIDGQRKQVPAAYSMDSHGNIGFKLGAYDSQAALVIDPVITFIAVFGGAHDESPLSIAVDGAGDAYVAGTSSSNDFPLADALQSQGPGSTSGQTQTCAFVSKLNATGTALIYSTYWGGQSTVAAGIAVDVLGRAYVTGSTKGGLATKNAFQPAFGGGAADAFLTVFNSTGNSLVYSTYLGDYGSDYATAITLDSNQNAFIAGYTLCYNCFPLLHSIDTVGELFAAKFNNLGVLQYSSVLNAAGQPSSIAVDGVGAAYVAGTAVADELTTTPGAFQRSCTFYYCGFVNKVGPGGDVLIYSTFLQGNQPVSCGTSGFCPIFVAVDSANQAYLAGTTGPGFPVHKTGFQNTYQGGASDGFVAKLNATGSNLIWSTYLGADGGDLVTGMTIDQHRTVYVTGQTQGPRLPQKAPVMLYDSGTGLNFITTLSGSLGAINYYSTFFGPTTGTFPGKASIAIDKSLNLYFAGTTDGVIEATPGALNTRTSGNPGGAIDAMVAKLVIMDDLSVSMTPSSSPAVHGSSLVFNIVVTSKGPNFGFNVQLSDTLPSNTTFASYDAGGGTCTAPAGSATNTLDCRLSQLDAGKSWTVKLTVNVNSAPNTVLSNTATAQSNMQDFTTTNNSATINVPVI